MSGRTRKAAGGAIWVALTLALACYLLMMGRPAPAAAGATLEVQFIQPPEVTWQREFEWGLSLASQPTNWDLFAGDTGTSRFFVGLEKTHTWDWIFQGPATVRVTNTGRHTTLYLSVQVDAYLNGDFIGGHGQGAEEIGPGESTDVYFLWAKSGWSGYYPPASQLELRAYATILNYEGYEGDWHDSPYDPHGYLLPEVPEDVHGALDVILPTGETVRRGLGGQLTFDRTYAAFDTGSHTEQVTSTHADDGTPGPSANAGVSVDLIMLDVSHDIETYKTLTHGWKIEKEADVAELVLEPGARGQIHYQVTVEKGPDATKGLVVSRVGIHNPSSHPVTLTAATVDLATGEQGPLDFAAYPPLEIGPGQTLLGICQLETPIFSPRLATANLTQQGYAYDWQGNRSPLPGSATYRGADVAFAGAQEVERDQTVTVTDTRHGLLGTVTAGVDPLPKVFSYTEEVGPYPDGSRQTLKNTARYEAEDSGKTGSAECTVEVRVGNAPPPPVGPTFVDVPEDHPYHEAVEGLADQGIIVGYERPDGKHEFRPGAFVLRAQFAKVICGALGVAVAEDDWPDPAVPFTDLVEDDPEDLYPHEYVARAYEEGITVGTTATTFTPWKDIPRAQVLSMVVRAIQKLHPGLLTQPPASYVGTWGDFSVDHAQNARIAEYNGLLAGLGRDGGHPDGNLAALDPWGTMPRGETGQVLWNVLQKLEAG